MNTHNAQWHSPRESLRRLPVTFSAVSSAVFPAGSKWKTDPYIVVVRLKPASPICAVFSSQKEKDIVE